MKKVILLVDDFENTLFVTGLTLKMAGYDILKAKSGKEALILMNGQRIDLIVTDYNMPEMNGLEFIEQAKTKLIYQNTPVFILSTEISQEVKRKAYDAGVTAWIAKPFQTENLKRKIARALH